MWHMGICAESSTEVFWILKLVVFESYEWLHRTDLSSELYFCSCCQSVLVYRRKFPTTYASSDKILTEILEKLCAAAHFLALDTPKTNMLLGPFLSTVAELTILVCIYSVKSWICILVDIPCLSVGGKNNTVGVCVWHSAGTFSFIILSCMRLLSTCMKRMLFISPNLTDLLLLGFTFCPVGKFLITES